MKNAISFLSISVVFLIGISNQLYSQNTDIWSGNYILKSMDLTPIDTIKIVKIQDVNKDDVASRYESDLNRWAILSKADNYEDKIKARRFLYDLSEDENEYEQFGWTQMYLKGEIKCLDAGHLFICQTQPNTTVKFSKDESFFTKTGIFGVRLHYGLFIMEKYSNP
ncbi:MAG: phosphate ABC transporter permease [Aestuariibaculum sp.]